MNIFDITNKIFPNRKNNSGKATVQDIANEVVKIMGEPVNKHGQFINTAILEYKNIDVEIELLYNKMIEVTVLKNNVGDDVDDEDNIMLWTTDLDEVFQYLNNYVTA